MGLLVKCINSLTSALEVCGQGKESKDLMMKVLKKRFAVYLGLEDVSEARKDLKKLVELIGNTS